MKSIPLLLFCVLLSCCSPVLPVENKQAPCKNGSSRGCLDSVSDTGYCKKGIQTCDSGKWSSCKGQVLPKAEVCNGVDDDCDGRVDEDFSCGVFPSLSGRSCQRVRSVRKIQCKDSSACQCYVTPDGREWTCFGFKNEPLSVQTLNHVSAQCGRHGDSGRCGNARALCSEIGGLMKWQVDKEGFLERKFY